MKGIYKIDSPTGGVYIGQAIDLQRRLEYHKYSKSPTCIALHNSFLKHGVDAHTFSIVCELPEDVTQETLTEYEQFYIDQYKDCGFKMLNICSAKYGRKGIPHTKEVCEKIRASNKLVERKEHTEESKQQISASLTGRTFSAQHRESIRQNMIGNKYMQGRKHSEATKEKMRNAAKNRSNARTKS